MSRLNEGMKKGALKAFSRRGLLVLSAAITIPALASLGGAYLLGSTALSYEGIRNQHSRMSGVQAQARLLVENVWDEIDGVKIRARAYARVRENARKGRLPQLNGALETFAVVKLDSKGQSIGITQFAKNPRADSRLPGNLRSEVSQAARKISLVQLRQSGVSLVPISEAPGEATQLLGIAFRDDSATSAGAKDQVDFVSVNPVDVFRNFSRWNQRREAGNLRGYLIGSDGKVWVHSERVYSGADFSRSEIFREALRPTFLGQRISGIGTYRAVDYRRVLTGYVRLATLPFAVVVERVVPPIGVPVLQRLFIPSALLLFASLLLCAFSALLVFRFLKIEGPAPTIESVPELEPALSELVEARELKNLKQQLQSAIEGEVGAKGIQKPEITGLKEHPLAPEVPSERIEETETEI